MYSLFSLVPKAYLSWAIGILASVRLPKALRMLLLNWYVKTYQVDLKEIELPLNFYPNLSAFFVRNLKDNARSIETGLVSPVDGTLRYVEELRQGSLTQVKGMSYDLTSLLQNAAQASYFENGLSYNLYLSPKDYHHVHTPITGTIVQTVHIPGKLWPVNNWSLQRVPNLFVENERVVMHLDTEYGKFAVVMVGATNVGQMSFAHIDLCTNSKPWISSKVTTYDHEKPFAVQAGDRVGTFHLGSSVILLCPKGAVVPDADSGKSVKYGEKIGDFG